MSTVGVDEAKIHLTRLLEEVQAGGTVTITQDGRPVARLVGIRKAPAPERDVAPESPEARGGRTLTTALQEALAEGRRSRV